MSRPTFMQGVGVAALVALLGEVAFVALSPLLGTLAALQIVIAASSFVYLLFLLHRSGTRIGLATTLAGWLLVTVATTWLEPPWPGYMLIHGGMIWLLRSLYYHRHFLTAAADLGLNAVAVAAAIWASAQSGSLFLTLWCFFLVQAVFVVIPRELVQPRGHKGKPAQDERFEQARRAAHTALRRLAISD